MTSPPEKTQPAKIPTETGPEAAARPLSPAAERALAEAAERRAAAEREAAGRKPEVGGREGPEPTRYGDWEKGGIASDF